MTVVFLVLPVRQYLGLKTSWKLIFTMLSESAVLVSLVSHFALSVDGGGFVYLKPFKRSRRVPHCLSSF